VARALRVEYLTVGWNVVEGLVAITAALAAGSVALLGFGIDSFVESASGSTLVWRLLAGRRATDEDRIEQVEQQARRLVAASLILLAAYIAWDSASSILSGERPSPRWSASSSPPSRSP
jgi:divalent metal cation (Fe/Co/Zn/Cd) transporter